MTATETPRMHCFICITCGVQHAPGETPPDTCDICTDERQYIGWEGQQWTTPAALRDDHALRVADDGGVLSLDIVPGFAIPQRAA